MLEILSHFCTAQQTIFNLRTMVANHVERAYTREITKFYSVVSVTKLCHIKHDRLVNFYISLLY